MRSAEARRNRSRAIRSVLGGHAPAVGFAETPQGAMQGLGQRANRAHVEDKTEQPRKKGGGRRRRAATTPRPEWRPEPRRRRRPIRRRPPRSPRSDRTRGREGRAPSRTSRSEARSRGGRALRRRQISKARPNRGRGRTASRRRRAKPGHRGNVFHRRCRVECPAVEIPDANRLPPSSAAAASEFFISRAIFVRNRRAAQGAGRGRDQATFASASALAPRWHARQRDDGDRPFAGARGEAQRAAVQFDQRIGDREAEARAFHAVGHDGVGLFERPPEPLDVLGRDARAVVLDVEIDPVGDRLRRRSRPRRPPARISPRCA